MAVFQSLLTGGFRNTNFCSPSDTLKRFARHFYVKTPLQHSYDADGKTIVNVLNNEEQAPLMINGYSVLGFRLNNGLFAVGPVALFPRSILSWNIKDDYDINERSLSLFLHLSPKLDILVIGLSDSRNYKCLINTRKNVYEIMKKSRKGEKTNIEVLPTERAVTTFNFLNVEGRFVGAALIPPTHYSPTIDDQYRVDYLNKKRDENDFLIESN